jgi:hypothetical protein
VVPYTFWDYFYSSLMNVIGIFIYLLILAFWDRVSLCSPCWSWTCDPPASASRVLGL